MSYAVIRLRGKVGLRREVRDTLRMLHLSRQNHCVIVPRNPTYEGMLQLVKDHVTWGEVDEQTLAKALLRRGRQVGDRPIDDAFVRTHSKFKSIWDLSVAVARGEATLKDVKDLRPVLRLHPPVRGLRGIKRGYHDGGDLGYRGPAINELLERMLFEEEKIHAE